MLFRTHRDIHHSILSYASGTSPSAKTPSTQAGPSTTIGVQENVWIHHTNFPRVTTLSHLLRED